MFSLEVWFHLKVRGANVVLRLPLVSDYIPLTPVPVLLRPEERVLYLPVFLFTAKSFSKLSVTLSLRKVPTVGAVSFEECPASSTG